MGINFPNAPTTNQLYPQPPVAGQPVYQWDGQKWTTQGAASTAYGAVRFDVAQALTAAQREQGRGNIAAATIANPSGNLIINGDMSISQENGTTAIAPANNAVRYLADQWQFFPSQAANTTVWTAGVAAGAPPIPGLINEISIGVSASSNWSAGAAGDYVALLQTIEGGRWSKLGWGAANVMPVSIGFWILPSVAGNLTLSVRNTGTRSYVTPISVVASVWQYKTVTIPGDVTGTWAVDNSLGAQITLCFGSGATYSTPNVNVWQAGNLFAHNGVTNFFAAPSSTIYLTGFSLIPGNYPVPLEQSAAIRRSPVEEMRLCRRYYLNSSLLFGIGFRAPFNSINGTYGAALTWPVEMRTTPSLVSVISGASRGYDGQWGLGPVQSASVGSLYPGANGDINSTGAYVGFSAPSGTGTTVNGVNETVAQMVCNARY